MKRVLGVVLLTGVVFGLNYIGIPGYVVALLIGFISSLSLLGHNQHGRVREKLALLAAFTAGAVAYCIAGTHAYGVYAWAAVFLAVGFAFTRPYNIHYRLWLKEILPPVLRFVMFERIGGAVSGLGYAFDIAGISISLRYLEAIVLLAAFIMLQKDMTAYILLTSQGAYGQRIYEGTKFRALKGFGKCAIIVAMVIVWFNPANLLVIDNMKNSVFDALTDFGGIAGSTVQTISDTNGTSLLAVKSDAPITNEQSALELLMSYDKDLGGEFVFTHSEKLASGNTVYSFSQTSNGIPLNGGGKNLVTGADNKPLYVVGTTQVGVNHLSVPSGAIGEGQAHNLVASAFGGSNSVSVGNVAIMWSKAADKNAYTLTYNVPLSATYEEDYIVSNNVVLDALSGDIVNVTGYSGGRHDALFDIFERIRENGYFTDTAFDAIIASADAIVAGTDANAWLYREVMMSECEKYYGGNPVLGKMNTKSISDAFADAGVDGNNIDEGIVSVDMQSSRASVSGMVNCPTDTDEIIISHSAKTTQQYTVTSDVPIMLTVAKENGEMILSLPVCDMETFEIYPTGKDERYILTVHAGSAYQKNGSKPSLPVIPNVLMAQPLTAVSALNSLFSAAEKASYNVTITQLNTDLRIENGDTIYSMLQMIENAYNTNNAARFLSLYRFDELSETFHHEFHDDFASVYGETYADFIDSSISSNALTIYAQTALAYYRTYNAVFKATADAHSALSELSDIVSDNTDKTAISFLLFGFQGNPEHWGDNFTSTWLHLDGTTLDLQYGHSDVRGDKTYINANAVIWRGDVIVLSKPITIVLQHFGNAQTISDDSGNGVSRFINGIGQYITSGDYLGLDLEGIQTAIKNSFNNGWQASKVTTPGKEEDYIVKMKDIARMANLSYADPYEIQAPIGYRYIWPSDWDLTYDGYTNFSVSLFYNETDNVLVCAFRGTVFPGKFQSNIELDWGNTLKYLLDEGVVDGYGSIRAHEQERSLITFLTQNLDTLISENDNIDKEHVSLILTGHSLGGYLALAAYEYLCDNNEQQAKRVIDVITFNALGINADSTDKVNHFMSKYSTSIQNIYSSDDVARWVCDGMGFSYPGISICVKPKDPLPYKYHMDLFKGVSLKGVLNKEEFNDVYATLIYYLNRDFSRDVTLADIFTKLDDEYFDLARELFSKANGWGILSTTKAQNSTLSKKQRSIMIPTYKETEAYYLEVATSVCVLLAYAEAHAGDQFYHIEYNKTKNQWYIDARIHTIGVVE